MNIFSANYDENQIKKEDWFNFERQFLLPSSLTTIFFAFISIFLNFSMEFKWELTVIPSASILIFLAVYLMAKHNKYLTFAKWLFISTSLVLINVVWYYNYGSRGPWFFLLVLLYSYLIFMMSGKQLFILSMILLINVIAFYLYEHAHPNALGDYPNNQVRLMDAYTAILLSGATAYVLMSVAKNAYLSEYKKAKTADKLKSSFLANMSHEIRTPLNAIVGFSNLLADGTIKEEEKEEYIAIINNSNETLLQLIDDILDVSMIEANQVKINKEKTSVTDLMRNLEKTYLPVLQKKGKTELALRLNIPEENYWIVTDAVRINQIMVNLLNNAVKFTEKGTLEFGFEEENNRLRFYVKDTGIGIEKAHLDHLFDRFYKIEDDNTKLYRGTGIGLYLCKRIVEMLGGSIHVDSEPGKGSEFYFYIPAEELEKKSFKPAKTKSTTTVHETGKKSGTLLIIEDDPSSRTYFKKVLEELNLNILEAADGKEGIRLFRENPDILVVLLDIRLPETSGFDIIKVLKKERPEVPVIAETAFAMAGDRDNCLKAGFDDYISKPVNRKTLIGLLNKYL